MTTLENLWYDKIRPVKEFVDGNTYCDISGIRKINVHELRHSTRSTILNWGYPR